MSDINNKQIIEALLIATDTPLPHKLCAEKLTIKDAVSETMKEKGPDPSGNAVLKYYPSSSADKTLNQLME